jgi:hypothetical protein
VAKFVTKLDTMDVQNLTIASGVVDQIATTDKKTNMTGIAKLKV